MSKVAIVTDSTANIPLDYLRGLEIHTIPLQVIWGEEIFRDSIDIQPDEFYNRLKTSKVMPTTSQPSPAAFKAVYEDLLSKGFQVLSVHISSKLSGTLDSAIQACQMLPGAPIELLDSGFTSLAMGFPVLLGARAAAQGTGLQETKTLVQNACNNSGVLFAVNTLEFLHRGGRIGGAAAFLGTALNLKPLLEVIDGRIELVERVRTMSKALDRLLDIFEARVGNRTPIHIGCVHAQSRENAELLLNKARARFGIADVNEGLISDISPVLGTHVGPGALGLVFMAGV